MLILQVVPLCKAAKLQETTEMQRQTNPPGERRKFPYQNPQGNTTKPKGLVFPWVPCFLLAVWNWVKYLHGNWRGTQPPKCQRPYSKVWEGSPHVYSDLKCGKERFASTSQHHLKKGNRDSRWLISCASTSHDASNVPPFLLLIGDGRWQNDIEFGGLEWWASSIHFVWGFDCLVKIWTLGMNFRHAYGGWSVQLVHKPQKISNKKQEWPKHPKVSGAIRNELLLEGDGHDGSSWLSHINMWHPQNALHIFRLSLIEYSVLFWKILRTPNKLRILLGRFLHPFPAPSHFQPQWPKGPTFPSNSAWTCPGSSANHMAVIPERETSPGSAPSSIKVDKTQGSWIACNGSW